MLKYADGDHITVKTENNPVRFMLMAGRAVQRTHRSLWSLRNEHHRRDQTDVAGIAQRNVYQRVRMCSVVIQDAAREDVAGLHPA